MANAWAEDGNVSVAARIQTMEAAAQRLQGELSIVLEGLAALREKCQVTEETAGDAQSDLLQKEVSDVLKVQAAALNEMISSTEAFPRRWARLELNTSQRKSLMLSVKARRRRDQQELEGQQTALQ
eukprot:TRINITY_DN11424_c3_g1_i1.p1 TRINITY_DN11424_c3_g1~~TRINITY_DN11424_c3_g1_i1.p1  ORF type:complete len:126 (+),score=30.82 TRINITY_DN11424_c3_g1_i1:82-459(+)